MLNRIISRLAWFATMALTFSSNKSFVDATKNADFFQACQDGDFDTVNEMVLDSPDLINLFSEAGETCLMLAAVENSYDIVQFLVIKGADINERAIGDDNHRMPVLGWHILAGNHQIVDFLIAHGVDLNQEFDGVDSEGNMFGIFTALDLIDFLIHNINDEKYGDIAAKYEATRDVLVEHGAKAFVGSMEF